MTVKEHYENHLSNFYEWMIGNFEEQQKIQQAYFETNSITPQKNRKAIDLGAGNGLQSISLGKMGWSVLSIDINRTLLMHLVEHKGNLDVGTIEADMLDFSKYRTGVELIVCMGDTIAHVDSTDELKILFNNIRTALIDGGKAVFSFRDYGIALEGINRFLPIRSDEDRILTTVLDFTPTKVHVTDQLYEKVEGKWALKISTYDKLRLTPDTVINLLTALGFSIVKTEKINGLIYTIVQK